MTGSEFERLTAEWLSKSGYWVLNIPKNSAGAQPFDILAIKDYECYIIPIAIDCKVCSTSPRFPLKRIEDNQWLSFEKFSSRVSNKHSIIGICIYYEGKVYLYPYDILKKKYEDGEKSIELSDIYLWWSE